MRGLKEILISFTLGMALLGAIVWSQEDLSDRDRPPESPVSIAGEPDDEALVISWGLKAVRAAEARRFMRGAPTLVAVIDTGADVHHPALAGRIWRNPGETGLDEFGNDKATNGRDDDGNGLVDDVHGWNFVNDSPDIMDEHGHGTHIAGLIGGRSTGVAHDVSLMILKYYDTDGDGVMNLKNTIRAIHYAVEMGARIINYSGGGMMRSRAEEEALRFAQARGVLVVAAAGNEGLNSDFHPFYPAGYDLPNILAVGAVDPSLSLLRLSNRGVNSVDITAPGRNVFSTLPGGTYGYMSGTSQATAFVSGAAALLWSAAPALSPEEIRARLMASGQEVNSLKSRTRSGRVLDVAASLAPLPSELAAVPGGRHPARDL